MFFRALNITERYPQYNVTFSGVGDAPPQHKEFGFCSQIAIFRKIVVTITNEVPLDFHQPNEETVYDDFDNSFGICTHYSYRKQIDLYESNISTEEKSINNHIEASNIYYRLLEKVEYPFDEDVRTLDEKILDEIKYNIYRFGSMNGCYFIDDRDRSEIPLYMVVKNNNGNFVTESEARYTPFPLTLVCYKRKCLNVISSL